MVCRFNGDGFDDLAVGSPGDEIGGFDNAGMVTVAYGSATGLTSRSFIKIRVDRYTAAGDRFGSSLATGDINADGYDDLIIGVPENTDVATCVVLWVVSTLFTEAMG